MIKGNNGRYYKLVGKKQMIKGDYITKRHSLYIYSDFCGDDTYYVTYVVYHGKKYPMNTFIRLSGEWGGCPIILDNGDIINGYNGENYYNPLMIAIDKLGLYARLYIEVKGGC